MKTKLFILAIAGLALASCSNDETVALNPNDAISFHPVTGGVTRATSKTAFVTNDVINVFAEYQIGTGTPRKYFQIDFTKQDGGNFTSSTLYYWPDMTSNTMTFTAFYGVAQSTTTAGSLTGAFTPVAAAASQTDILYARKAISNAPERPVALNFRHMLSQIDVKVKNGNSSLKFNVTGVRIGYVSTSGAFACTTVTTGDGNLAQNSWTPVALTGTDEEKANSNKYEQTSLNFNVAATDASATTITGFGTWMLVPQSQTKASAYTTSENGASTDAPKLNGAYLAIQMSIMNNDANSTQIVANQWCYWPITLNWTPGYKYTYTVDLANGGYQPTDTDNDGAFDPVLDTPIEMSASCSIDSWDESNSNVPES